MEEFYNLRGLETRVLVDDHVDNPRNEKPSRMLGQFMRNESDLRLTPRRLEGSGDAAVAGGDVVDADDVAARGQKAGGLRPRLLDIVAHVAHIDHVELRVRVADQIAET